MNNRDSIVLSKIMQYVDEITITLERYDLDYDRFVTDFVVKNAIANRRVGWETIRRPKAGE